MLLSFVSKSLSIVASISSVVVGVSRGLSLPLAVVDSSVAVGRDQESVLLDDGIASRVGDHGAGADSKGTLACVVDLGVESGGSKDGGHLMDSSLQVTVVSSISLVAPDNDGDSIVKVNNIGLNSWGYGFVGEGLHSGDGSVVSVGKESAS